MEQSQLVTVASYFHPTEAHIAAGRVEAEGIPVHLHGINHVSANWLLAVALGGVKLQVPSQFVNQAREVLETEYEMGEDELEKCPECGSSDITSHTSSWKLSILAIHLLYIPLPWRKDQAQCRDCGHKWKTS